jgi:N-methylhydantoinase A
VPALPGALSAVGILLADTMREYSRTVMLSIDAPLEVAFSELEKVGTEEFRAENLTGQSFRSVDVRYQGQGYELNVPFGPNVAAQFHDLHMRRYGFANEDRRLEVVNVRVRMVSAAEAFEPITQPISEGDGSNALIGTRPVYFDNSFHETRVYDRDLLRPGDTFAGPAIVSEYSSATVLPLGDVLRVDGLGNLVIEVHG